MRVAHMLVQILLELVVCLLQICNLDELLVDDLALRSFLVCHLPVMHQCTDRLVTWMQLT